MRKIDLVDLVEQRNKVNWARSVPLQIDVGLQSYFVR